MKKENKNIGDVFSNTCGTPTGQAGVPWAYSDTVKDHFFNPRNVLGEGEDFKADGTGVVGSPACGDVMLFAVSIDPDTKRIRACRWRTFGCASAIASTSMLSVMALEDGGMTLGRARRVKPEEIIERLGGLPDRKYHCSVLGHEALAKAIEEYEHDHA